MNEYTQPEDVGILRLLAEVTVAFNKMMIPVAIGGIAVAGPWTLFLTWFAQQVQAFTGDAVAAVILIVFMMLTVPLLAMTTLGVIMKIEQIVPWDVWEEYYAYP